MSKTGITNVKQIGGTRKFFRDSFTDVAAYTKISSAKAGLMLAHPFWGFMGLDLVLVEAPQNCVFGTLATDGYHIFYSPKFVNSLRPGEVTFGVAHEIYHCLFGHTMGQGLVNRRHDDWDPALWNKAIDYVVNYDLRQAKIGEFITTIKILYDEKYAGMSSEEVYMDLLKNGDPQSDVETLDAHIDWEIDGDPSSGGDESDDDSDGGEGDSDGETEAPAHNEGRIGKGKTISIRITQDQAREEDTRWQQIAQRAVAHVENSSDAAGSIPAFLRRLIAEIGKPKIDWRAALRKFIVSVRKSGYSYLTPDKRTFNSGLSIPGFRRNVNKLTVAVAFDTSGSVGQDALTKFVSEFLGMMKSYAEYEIHTFCFEGDVDEGTYLLMTGNSRDAEANMKKYAEKISGGGGTMFQSIWDFLRSRKIRPRGLVVFTDGYPCDSTWHKERMYCPTMFVTVGNHNAWKAPFGLTVAYEDMG